MCQNWSMALTNFHYKEVQCVSKMEYSLLTKPLKAFYRKISNDMYIIVKVKNHSWMKQ